MKAFDNFYALDAKTKLKVLNEIVRREPEKHLSLLEECLEDRNELIRTHAQIILEELRNQLHPNLDGVDKYVKQLCVLTEDGELEEEANALAHFYLESLGVKAWPILLEYLNDEQYILPVLNVLTNVGGKKIIPLFIERYPKVSETCQLEILREIAYLDSVGYQSFFRQCAQNGGSQKVRNLAKRLLRERECARECMSSIALMTRQWFCNM
ncbi:hypothetical protein FJZ31_36410 [Candidatus Poribacteria bacterium]|nr:hypothetical protein [Candidatus Poribacteria bacterium]